MARWARKAARSNNHLLTTIVQRFFGVTLRNSHHFLPISLTCSHFVSLANIPIISALPLKVREVIDFFGKDNEEWLIAHCPFPIVHCPFPHFPIGAGGESQASPCSCTYCMGDWLKKRVKVWVKWLWSEKPQSMAIVEMV